METIIKLDSIYFGYHEDENLIKNIKFEINKKDFLVILGSNGSGKSTLSKLILGLEKISFGDIKIDNLSVKDKKNIREVRKKIGMILQNTNHQIINSIVEKDIAFTPENYGYSTEKINEMVDEAIKIVGLEKSRYKNVNELSEGEKQKVAIAGVLAIKPDVIILDESTAMLDYISRINVLEFLKEINEKYGTTIILITHNIDEIRYANRCLVMEKGEIAFDTTPLDLISKVGELKKLKIEIPEATQLIYELRKSGIDIPYKLDIEEVVEELWKLF